MLKSLLQVLRHLLLLLDLLCPCLYYFLWLIATVNHVVRIGWCRILLFGLRCWQ
jgi:hypothetical protein